MQEHYEYAFKLFEAITGIGEIARGGNDPGDESESAAPQHGVENFARVLGGEITDYTCQRCFKKHITYNVSMRQLECKCGLAVTMHELYMYADRTSLVVPKDKIMECLYDKARGRTIQDGY